MRLPLIPLGLLACGALPLLAARPAPPASAAPPSPQGAAIFRLIQAGHGFGQVLPHRIERLDDFGNPTGIIDEIRTLSDLETNFSPQGNPVLPSPPLPTGAVIPGGTAGNHYLVVTMTQDIDPASVFDFSPSGLANNSLGDLVRVEARGGSLSAPVTIPGRVFVGGSTPGRQAVGGVLPLLSLVRQNPGGGIVATQVDEDQDGDADGLGFPGTVLGFAGAEELISRRALVFVPDSDDDLLTYETLPAGASISMIVRAGLRSRVGGVLQDDLLVSTTVGPDAVAPLLLSDSAGAAQVIPANLATGVDPATQIELTFTEPMQPDTVGSLPSLAPDLGGVRLGYGGTLGLVMPYQAQPASVFSLDRWILTPVIGFPGQGTSAAACGPTSQVTVGAGLGGDMLDLSSVQLIDLIVTEFGVGPGPGIVNAPVAPDSILIGRSSPAAVSVLDLNGFGASTGSPRFSFDFRREGDSNYPNNPNVLFQNGLGLVAGTCTVDGGSAGVFTLTLDTNLDSALARQPQFADTTDMALGNSLDTVFNNALFPFGCQSLGGDVCALDGLKRIAIDIGPAGNAVPGGALSQQLPVGYANLLSWAPHPNPPPLAFPPICAVPQLFGEEPVSTDIQLPNLLAPGDPFGTPLSDPPIPPSGLFSDVQNSFFVGPSDDGLALSDCEPYMQRQQVGNFQYLLDGVRGEVVVMNSNLQTVLDRIPMGSSGRLALAPNLDYLAVTQTGLDQVSFVDIRESSATFHQVVQVIQVGSGPLGVSWQSDNEDILVCNELDGSLSVISALTLQERSRVDGFLTAPFEVVALPRMEGFSFERNVYFAYILQRDGSLAVFESGPNGSNGWGYDDVIGTLPFEFQNPKAMNAGDPTANYGVWIAHEGPIDPVTGQAGAPGVGAITRVGIQSALPGVLILGGMAGTPQFRSMDFSVQASVGEPVISGIPVDLAFDNLNNVSALQASSNLFSAGIPIPANGRGLVRRLPNGGPVIPTNRPKVLLAAMPGPDPFAIGVVDAISLQQFPLVPMDTNPFQPGQQSVPVRGARVLVDAFRQ